MVYGKEVVMPIEYIVPSIRILAFTNMVEPNIMEECLVKLVAMEKDWLISQFHQQVQKDHEKSSHDQHIW